MNDTMITIQGNILNDVSIRSTKGGHDVASFRVASTPRRFDKTLNQWVDGQSSFFSVSCWRALARNVAASLSKGMPVVVHGRMTQRPYDREVNGQIVRSYSLDLDAKLVGPDLTRGVAKFERVKSNAVRMAEARARADIAAVADASGPLVPQGDEPGPDESRVEGPDLDGGPNRRTTADVAANGVGDPGQPGSLVA